MRKLSLAAALALLCGMIAAPQSSAEAKRYKTQNVIVAVMDGVRYSETFGDPNRALIPNLSAMAKDGTLFTNFRIAGPGISVTRQGHSTISTGTWQTVALGGARMTVPTFFEYARNELGWRESDCYSIFGKGPYSYARYSSFPTYGEKYKPSFVIGIGEAEMKNDDSVLDRVVKAMDEDKPKLIFINFGVTDHVAHVSTFEDYQAAIRHCDEIFGKLWQKAQSTPGYKDATTILFTNDHGRHNDKPQMPHKGFASHGDTCDGCRHIMLLAIGPDIKPGAVLDREVQEIDITPTVGELLGFQTPLSEGSVISDCLADPLGINMKATQTAEAREAVRLNDLSKRNMVKVIADANLKRSADSLAPGFETVLLMRGMLEASAVTGDSQYRQYVQAWVKKNTAGAVDNPYVGVVALELVRQKIADSGLEGKLKDYAAKCAQATPTDDQAAAARAAFLAKGWQVFQDRSLREAAKTALGFAGKTEDELVADWKKLKVQMTPMACDVSAEVTASATMADARRLLLLADAAQAMPRDRITRLACDLQESVCSQGRSECGANWKDPVQSALTLAALVEANGVKPKMQWVDTPKTDAKKKAQQGPRWAFPMQFYKDSIPWQTLQLKYLVSSDGHFANGEVMSDGAALLLFCASSGMSPAGGRLQTYSN